MKKRVFLYFCAAMLIGCTGIGAAQQDTGKGGSPQAKVPPELWQKIREKGVVNVIVQLNVPWQPEELE